MASTPYVVIAGATGMIGTALIDELLAHGFDVVRLVRSYKTEPDSRVIDSYWDPASGVIDFDVIDGAYGVVNLAGSSIGAKRWDRIIKKDLKQSRINSTKLLVRAINKVAAPPKVFLSGSATGYYGFPGKTVTEGSPSGNTFLAGLCVDWERIAAGALASGTRVAYLRTGLVMAPQGGALKKILVPLRLGVGGPLGDGTQIWSWISLKDEVRAIRFLLENERGWGPINLVNNAPTTNLELTEALADRFGRSARFKVPAKALRLALGEFATEITNGVEVAPTALNSLDFTFEHSNLDELTAWVKAQP